MFTIEKELRVIRIARPLVKNQVAFVAKKGNHRVGDTVILPKGYASPFGKIRGVRRNNGKTSIFDVVPVGVRTNVRHNYTGGLNLDFRWADEDNVQNFQSFSLSVHEAKELMAQLKMCGIN